MKKRSRTEYSLINIMAGMGGYGLNILVSFVCRMIFVRCLSTEYLGINGLFSNILSMLSLSELGIGTAMGYALYRPVAVKDEKKIASYMKLYGTAYRIIGLAVAVLGVALMPFLPVLVGEMPDIPENLYVIYGLFLFNTVSRYFLGYRYAVLMADQRNYVVLAISYVLVVVQNALQITVLLCGGGYMLYLLIQIASSLVTNLLISCKAAKDYPYIKDRQAEPLSKEEKHSLMRNVKALTVTKLSGVLVNNTDNIVITYFNGLVTTGVISNYTLLSGMLTSLVTQVFTGFSASVGNLNAVESDEHKYRIFKALNLANFWLYGWGAVGIAVVSGDLVSVFFGEQYMVAGVIPLLLAVNFYMLGMQSVVGMYKSSMGLFRYGQYTLLVTAALNLIGDVVLGRLYGVAGILAATALARLVSNTWYEPYVVFKHGLKRSAWEYLPRYLGYAALLAAVMGGCFLLTWKLVLPPVWRLTVKLAVCVVVPNGVFALVFWRSAEFQYLLGAANGVWQKIKGRLCRR